jgi:hypothetical protein
MCRDAMLGMSLSLVPNPAIGLLETVTFPVAGEKMGC